MVSDKGAEPMDYESDDYRQWIEVCAFRDLLASIKTGSTQNSVLDLMRRHPGADSLYFKAEKYPSDES